MVVAGNYHIPGPVLHWNLPGLEARRGLKAEEA